jgi:hypothetical protein
MSVTHRTKLAIINILEEMHMSSSTEGKCSGDSASSSSFEQACRSIQDKRAPPPSHYEQEQPDQTLSFQNVVIDTNEEGEPQGRKSSSNRPDFLHWSLDEMVHRDESNIDTVYQLEPTPINLQGTMFHTVERIHRLPENITRYSEEYLTALSHLKHSTSNEECQQDESNPPASITSASSSQLQQQTDSDSDDQLANPPIDPSMRIHPFQNERWMERYQDLLVYHRLRGHCNVPRDYKNNRSLGQWVKRQRHQYKLLKQGQHSHLTQDRIQILEVLGFIWDSHGAAWEEKHQELKEFRNAHGHCNVPYVYQGSPKLSTWIKRQRRQYKLFVTNQPSTMTHERIAKLESLGFVWDCYGSKAK